MITEREFVQVAAESLEVLFLNVPSHSQLAPVPADLRMAIENDPQRSQYRPEVPTAVHGSDVRQAASSESAGGEPGHDVRRVRRAGTHNDVRSQPGDESSSPQGGPQDPPPSFIGNRQQHTRFEPESVPPKSFPVAGPSRDRTR